MSLLNPRTKPLIKPRMAFLTIVGFWLFLFVTSTLRSVVLEFPDQFQLTGRRAAVTVIGIFLTWLLYMFLRLFDRQRLAARITAAAFGALPCALAIAVANYYVFNYDPISLFEDPNLGRKVIEVEALLGMTAMQEVAEITITRYFFVIAWALLYLALGYAREVGEAERMASRYAQAAKDAELRSLRYQVNPHFLFNTLNSLSSLVVTGRNIQAEAMIQNLSAFYRNSLSSDPLADVTLSEEIAMQKLYLDIETLRYPARLRSEIVIDPLLENMKVPALILQPLVENAIKHGVATSDQPVTLRIEGRILGGQAVITISDDNASPSINSTGNGIGIANVRDRLQARYGDAAQFTNGAKPGGGYTAILSLPYCVAAL